MADQPATRRDTIAQPPVPKPGWVSAASVIGAVGEVGGKAAPPVQLPTQRGVIDTKRAGDDFLAWPVQTRYAAGHRGGREDRSQRGVLLVAGPLIEVQADPPR